MRELYRGKLAPDFRSQNKPHTVLSSLSFPFASYVPDLSVGEILKYGQQVPHSLGVSEPQP